MMKPVRSILIMMILLALAVPAARAVDELSLERCVELALERNQAVVAAEHKLAEAGAKAQEKGAALWPSLDLSASYTRLPYASTSKASILGSSLDDYSLAVYLTQPLYAGGRLRSERQSAELEYDKAADELDRTRTDLVLDVTAAYYGARHAAAVLEAKRESYRNLADFYRRSSVLAQKTLLPRPEDLLQIEVQMVNASMEVAAAETASSKALRRLLDLIRSEEPAILSDPLPEPATDGPPAALPLESNYQYRAALNDLAIARQAVTVSRSALLPELNLSAYSAWEWAELPPSYDYSQWGVSLSLLLFDFLKTPAKVRQSELKLEQGQAGLETLEHQLRLAYRDRLDEFNSARRRFELAEENLARAEQSRKLYQARSQSYTVNSKQLLDAEQAALLARLNRLNVLLDHHLSRLALARLLGREKI
jgi:outer membrane protein